MAPRRFSRYMFSKGFVDTMTGAFMLEDVTPVAFVERLDTRTHTIVEGDDLFYLAARYFASYTRPNGLFWVIADFQPDPPDGLGPIIDPTRTLPVGATIFIPSERFVEEEIFNQKRRLKIEG